MTGPNLWLFWFSAILAVVGALGTVTARRPLRAALGLLTHIIALAGLYLTLHAQLLAALQVLVYAGAVVVLFIFVIMMIGPASEGEPSRKALFSRVVSLVALGALGAVVAISLLQVPIPYVRLPEGYGTVEGLGMALYRGAAVPFELVSITLLIAIVAAVTIARGRTRLEAEAALQKKLEKEARAKAKLAEEQRVAAEVSAHGGH